ncbi:hypothetical protein ABZ490_27265 [Streptomyces sp. NPDC005811]|uniref:hypothetical protein n=1 Tax=Streptomyces sp. NPDC005811 TaxID=3154565 RepID=UPI0033EBAEA4
MRQTATAVLLAVTLALAGCSGGSGDTDAEPGAEPGAEARSPTPTPTPTPTPSATQERLRPVWGPRLEAAAGKGGEGTSACHRPSSDACAGYVRDIMAVVTGLADAIRTSGRAYPKARAQIARMKHAQAAYAAAGCHGDPAADDPDSRCHGVVAVTIGASTLDVTLLTDEFGR